MYFDLSQVPSSKRGSYFAISELTDSMKKDAQKLCLNPPALPGVLMQSKSPVKRVVCTRAISPWYRPASKGAGFVSFARP